MCTKCSFATLDPTHHRKRRIHGVNVEAMLKTVPLLPDRDGQDPQTTLASAGIGDYLLPVRSRNASSISATIATALLLLLKVLQRSLKPLKLPRATTTHGNTTAMTTTTFHSSDYPIISFVFMAMTSINIMIAVILYLLATPESNLVLKIKSMSSS